MAGWPAALDGLVVALAGDIHLGRAGGRAWTCPGLKHALRSVRVRRPDLLVLCGDFGFKDWNPADLAAIMGLFEARLRVAVMGNHDYAQLPTRAEALRAELESRGISVLVNQARRLTVRGADLWVAGLNDPASGRADWSKLLDELPDGARPALLACHSPTGVLPEHAGRFDLAVCGHTHGGQIALPLLNRFILQRFARTSFDRGLYHVGALPVYVTKGLGMVRYHLRFRACPEVVYLRLRSAAAS